MKLSIRKMICMSFFLLLVLTVSGQTYEIQILDKKVVDISNVQDLEYNGTEYIFFSDSKLFIMNSDGDIIKTHDVVNITGIAIDKSNQKLILIDQGTCIRNFEDNGIIIKAIITDRKGPHKEKWIQGSRFLAKCADGYYTYILAGWSSRFSLIDNNGYEVSYYLAPGYGTPSGLTCNNQSLWVVFDLGQNKNGVLREYDISNKMIKPSSFYELPLAEPRGLAIDNDGDLHTFFNQSNEIIKLRIDTK